jgi:pimeloyl-ACP methyl ester carboxylesterase
MEADQGRAMSMDIGMRHNTKSVNGIDFHYVEQGQGPLVIFCHGFPESWYSWRHQVSAISAAGYRAVALDMRGYGQSGKPEAIEEYTLSHLVGDVVGMVTALGSEQAIIVGHDWGAPVAWYSALMRPDIFTAVAVLSVPYNPPTILPAGVDLNDVMAANAGDRNYYRLYFQEPGIAEADLEEDIRRTLLGFFYTLSGDIVADGVHHQGWDGYYPRGQSLSSQLVIPKSLPAWLTEQDLQFYVDEFTGSGFFGGINWYRNIKRIPGILAPFAGAKIHQPALYLYGEHDLVCGNTPETVDALDEILPNLKNVIKIPGAGHWLQQERAEEVNSALIEFLDNLPR